jgi:conjugative transfer pilus assembly protein TraH
MRDQNHSRLPRRRSVSRGLAAVLAVSLGAAPPASADMAGQMAATFDSLVNTTPPGFYDTARRGELSGGSIYVRNRIVNPNMVGFNPPSFRGGCGGIDFFAGSFSFINAQQFVQLMRAVAANAAGYAFNFAMGVLCRDCMQHIETLQRKIQELNQFFGNSCQLAQGVVNDGVSAFMGQKYGEASVVGMVEGVGDVFESWSTSDGTSPTEALTDAGSPAMEERIEGNVVWRALKRNNTAGWFVAGGGDALDSILMSISGTVIVEWDDATDEPELRTLAGNPELIESWVFGREARYYSCAGEGENGCLAPTTVTSSWASDAFVDRIYDRLTNPTDGLIRTIRANAVPSLQDRALVAAMPGSAGAMFVRLAAISDQAAVTFAREAANHLALEMASNLLRDLSATVGRAVDASDDPFAAEVRRVMADAARANEAELARLQRKFGSAPELVGLWNDYLDAIQPVLDGATRSRLVTSATF